MQVRGGKGAALMDGNQRGIGKLQGDAVMKSITLLTSKRVAEMLSIPEGTLRYWRATGIGPVWHKLEGSIRYDESDVSRYVEKNRRIPSVRAFMEDLDGSQ